MHFEVNVAKSAFPSMVLGSVEAFAHGDSSSVPKKSGARAVEVIGPVWGSVKRESGRTILDIEHVAVSLASQRSYSGCEMPEATQRLLADTMEIIRPEAVLLGDFHSHPWKGGLAEGRNGYEFTSEDLMVFREDPLIWERSSGNPVILVLTICRLARLMSRSPERLRSDLWSFDVGEHRCWLAAIVGFGNRQHTAAGDRQVVLNLDLQPFAQRRLKGL